jgi:hypothetical protein
VGHGAGSIAVECKNWLAGNGSLPEIELVGYIARLTARGMSADNTRRELYLRWRVPCLGLTIVEGFCTLFNILITSGSDISFYGIVAIDQRFRIINLTPSISYVRAAGEDRSPLFSP